MLVSKNRQFTARGNPGMTQEQRRKQCNISLSVYAQWQASEISTIYYHLLTASNLEPWEVWQIAERQFAKRER
jgi:hypothetical protein